MKKYLSVVSKNEVEMYSIVVKKKHFTVVKTNSKDSRRLKIPYNAFYYPQFIYDEKIEQEILMFINKMFSENREKAILINYSKQYEDKIMQIIIRNKLEFD